MAEHVKAALGVTLTRREFALEVREPSAPPVNVSYAFDAAFTTVCRAKGVRRRETCAMAC